MERLPISDVRRIVRLLADVAVSSTDLPGKRRFLMQGLAKLIGADCWMWVHFKDQERGNTPTMFMFIDGGWQSEQQRLLVAAGTNSPAMKPVNILMRKGADVHRTRRVPALLSKGRWIASDLVQQYFQPGDIGDWLWSVYPLGDKVYSSINFMRRADRPSFNRREVCITHLITGEIDWLHRDGTNVPAAAHVNELSTRQRQVLIQLMSGDSAKQIARKLSLSIHTVNDHIKTIYRHFDVSGRGELLAQFRAGGATTHSNS